MKKPLWFKRKSYGWGWTPATWQGWLTLAGFLALMVANTIRLNMARTSVNDFLINFIPQTILLVLVLILICYMTGETPKWQWGDTTKR